MEAPVIERQIRLAGILVVVGLVIQLASLIWNHPLAFLAFLFLGCPPVLAGILLYLYSLVSRQTA